MKRFLTAIFVLAFFASTNSAFAATVYVDAGATGAGNGTTQADAYTDLGTAISAGTTNAGDEIQIFGPLTITSQVAVNKQVTLQGMTGAVISTSGTDYVLNITAAGTSVKGITFTKTDSANQNMVLVNANDVTIDGNNFQGTYNIGDGQVSRGLEVSGVTGLVVNNNTFNHLRQPGYFNTATGSLTNNYAGDTKGFVIVSNSNLTITGNSFGNNVGDIAIICPTAVADNATCPDTNNYPDNVALSNANNGAVVDKQVPVKDNATLSVVYVDANASAGGNGTLATPYQTITAGLSKVADGGVVNVADGSYTEDLTINKKVTLTGPNSTINPITGTRTGEATLTGKILVTSGDVSIKGFTITNPSWNGVSIKGIQLYSSGPTISNITIQNNIITNVDNANTKGAYGVMVQADVSNVLIDSNLISDITSAGWARGIEVTAGCNVTNVPASVTITNNKITNVTVTAGTDVYDISIDWCDSPVQIADASQVILEDNSFDSVKVKNLDTTHPLVITKNWWGSAVPDFTGASGSVTSDPWCTNSVCTTFYTPPPAGASDWASHSTTNGSVTGTTTVATTTPVSTGTTTTVIQPATSTPQVLGATVFKFTKNLGYGSRGEDVSELQKILIAKGYLKLKTGLPTGWFGPLTTAALMKWQKDNGVPPTGFFGKLSQDKLNQ